jgi:hypothetical protein
MGVRQTNRKTAHAKSYAHIKEAEWPVVSAFQDLQHAWLLQENPPPDLSVHAIHHFERKSWDRLLRYLTNRPIPRN